MVSVPGELPGAMVPLLVSALPARSMVPVPLMVPVEALVKPPSKVVVPGFTSKIPSLVKIWVKVEPAALMVP